MSREQFYGEDIVWWKPKLAGSATKPWRLRGGGGGPHQGGVAFTKD